MTTATLPTERSVVLDDVSWSFYQNMLAEIGDTHIRLTFDQGRLEIMSPSPRHEMVKKVLARLIEAYADTLKITIEGLGSSTFSREDLQKGLEPDECYYIANAALIRGKQDLDLSIDPPPDLAIEIDISSRSVTRQPIYAALGVGEIWRYDGKSVSFLMRSSTGGYSASATSAVFPQFFAKTLNELLLLSQSKGQSAAVAELRRRLQ